MFYELILLSVVLNLCHCDWASEWMSPIREQFEQSAPPKIQTKGSIEDDDLGMGQMLDAEPLSGGTEQQSSEFSKENLKVQIERALQTAQGLVDTLKKQIAAVASKEHLLKDAIANGRAGMTTVTVSTAQQAPRTYIIRDGHWTLCNGMVQFPPANGGRDSTATLYNRHQFEMPRCIGREMQSQPDPCVFNSLIKYETIPTRRGIQYREDDYFCLKSTFKDTMEQYLSVPRRVINDTCRHGTVKSVADYTKQCGVRIMSEYSYYPHRSSAAAALPLEYCKENDGSCRLVVAWHLTNATVENFGFLKHEYNFKNYFMKPDHFIEHAM